MRLPGIGSHHSARVMTDEWWTPPYLTDALGAFDLDPCSPPGGWVRAAAHYTAEDDGLSAPWCGRVWLNPPYSEVEQWMRRMADHGQGIALVFARTETRWWFESVWPRASAVLFLRGRLSFIAGGDVEDRGSFGAHDRALVASEHGKGHNAGGPSALIAYGSDDAQLLKDAGLDGAFVALSPQD